MKKQILSLAFFAMAILANRSEAQTNGSGGSNSSSSNQSGSSNSSSNQTRAFGSFGYSADTDISLAYFFIDQAIMNATTVTPTMGTGTGSTGTGTGSTGTGTTTPTPTMVTIQFTSAQLALLVDAKNNLYNGFTVLVISNGDQRPFVKSAVVDILNTNLIDSGDLNAAIASGSFIAGSHPKSNNSLWIALWTGVFAYYDTQY